MERIIQENIEYLHGHYTILVVAHRLSTIKNVDRMVLLDEGKILDIDSFDNLYQRHNEFKKMVDLQELK